MKIVEHDRVNEAGEGTPSFDELLNHEAWLSALASQLTRDPHAAQDLVQETWLAAIRSGPIAKPRGFLKAVMCRLAQRRVRDESYHDHEAFDDEVDLDHPTQAPAEEAARLSVRHRIVGCVMEMRDPDRNLLLHHYYYSRDFDELARLLGLPRERVAKRLFAARERLRRVLEREKIGGASLYSCLGLFVEGPARTGALQPTAPSVLRLASVGGWALVLIASGVLVSRAVLRSDDVASVAKPSVVGDGPETAALPEEHLGSAGTPDPLPEEPRTVVPTHGGALDSRSAMREVAVVGSVGVRGEDGSRTTPGMPLDVVLDVCAASGRLDADGCGAVVKSFAAVTDPEGAFRLALTVPDEVLRLRARVVPRGPEYAGYPATPVTLALGSEALELELWVLPFAYVLHGVVLDPGGSPLAGATVTSVGRAVSTTDAAGAFAIPMLGWQEDAITVRADGYVTEEVLCAPGRTVLDPIRLLPERPVSVLVRTPPGQPLAGVRVGVLGRHASFVTDADGRATIHGIGERRVRLVFESDDRARYERPLELHESSLDVRIPDGVTLSGTVRDAGGKPQRGEPVDAVIRASQGATSGALTFSDRDGSYRLLVPAGMATVTFGGARGERSLRMVSVGPHGSEEDLFLGTPLRVVGLVLREDGTPAEGARVTPYPNGAETGSVLAAADGTFVLDLQDSAGVFIVLAGHVLRGIPREELLAGDPITLRPAGRFLIQLVAAGAPPQGVRIRSVDASASTPIVINELHPWTEEPFELVTSAVAVGQRATFELTADGYAPVVFELEALAGEEPRPRTVVLGTR